MDSTLTCKHKYQALHQCQNFSDNFVTLWIGVIKILQKLSLRGLWIDQDQNSNGFHQLVELPPLVTLTRLILILLVH